MPAASATCVFDNPAEIAAGTQVRRSWRAAEAISSPAARRCPIRFNAVVASSGWTG